MGFPWRKLGRVVAAPVTLPAKGVDKLFTKTKEKMMGAMIAGIVRHVLTAVGGGLVANGTLADSELQQGIGAVVTIVGIVASVVSKRKAAAAAGK